MLRKASWDRVCFKTVLARQSRYDSGWVWAQCSPLTCSGTKKSWFTRERELYCAPQVMSRNRGIVWFRVCTRLWSTEKQSHLIYAPLASRWLLRVSRVGFQAQLWDWAVHRWHSSQVLFPALPLLLSWAHVNLWRWTQKVLGQLWELWPQQVSGAANQV